MIRFRDHVEGLEQARDMKIATPPSSLMVDAAAMDALRASLAEAVPAN
jgi:hypothetical protein